jgi:phosphoglycolate phosphatase
LKFRLIVFDLDGTLIDSRRDIAESANLLLEESGASRLDEDTIGRMVGEGAALLVARAFAAADIPQPPHALQRFLEIYETRLLIHTTPYEGIEPVLQALDGRATLAVLTNKPLRPTTDILKGLGLARYFRSDAVIGGDGPFPRKPDPAALRHLMRQAGTDTGSTLLVGDSIIDWRTAKNASARICMAAYGFGFSSIQRGELTPEDLLIAKPTDLLEHVTR